MARDFVAASDMHLKSTVAPVTTTPCTIIAWGKPDNATHDGCMVSISNSGSLANLFYILFAGDNPGDPIAITQRGSSTGTAAKNGLYSGGEWHCVGGLFVSSTSRALWVDGVEEATDATDIGTFSGVDQMAVGVRLREAASIDIEFDGLIGRVLVYDVVLAAGEMVAIQTGKVSPIRVRPGNLKRWYEIEGVASPEPDWSGGGNNATLVNGPTQADHPPVATPFGVDLGWEGIAAAAVAAGDVRRHIIPAYMGINS